ncbi:hypothetical protein C8A00DRAFT_35437 [Chaetomidium leptoderma]|uniref:Uncharacterized protein n=1 Tax=Chaetomidium leptoderma TaxID=669021 RepID=A0AAN6VII7_9PEZI|nr:hypothetical protein C8A00DRAFT_35437 [Chaetomidium leptoderma]
MNACYCSNHYSAIRCTNTVGKFGQRCKLCTILKSGTSLTPGMLPDDSLSLIAHAQSHEERDDHSDKSFNASRRSSWSFGGLSLSTSSKKSTPESSLWRSGRSNLRV